MGIIAFLILGLVAGLIAKALMPGEDGGGLLMTMLLGVVGALVAGFAAGAIFSIDPMDGFFEISTWLAAIAGSVAMLALYRAVTRDKGNRISS
jgi:uncharacterized membrane protein YeaQ/YmgE (transglycosylase-associated protein family)